MGDTISITSIEQKAERLEAELKELKLLLQLARKHAPPPYQSTQQLSQEAVDRLSAKQGTKRQRICDATKEILADGKRRLSRELLPELEKRGVVVGGKNPKSLLASYLSNFPDVFESDTKIGGWALRNEGKEARASEVAASLALFTNGSQATHRVVCARKEDAEFG